MATVGVDQTVKVNSFQLAFQKALVVLPILMRWPCLAILSPSSPIIIRGFSAGLTGASSSSRVRFCLAVLLGGSGRPVFWVVVLDVAAPSFLSTPNCVSPLMLLMSQTWIVESCDPVYSLSSTTYNRKQNHFYFKILILNIFKFFSKFKTDKKLQKARVFSLRGLVKTCMPNL